MRTIPTTDRSSPLRFILPLLAVAAAVALALAPARGLAAGPAPAPPCAVRASLDVTGRYGSNWGPVQLHQRGPHISGRYTCCGGGHIEGKLEGNVIRYRWSQPDGSGKGVWAVTTTGELIGSWGATDEVRGGAWNLRPERPRARAPQDLAR